MADPAPTVAPGTSGVPSIGTPGVPPSAAPSGSKRAPVTGDAARVDATTMDPMEARVQSITAELRCLVCQNQTVADSTSDLANDLRREVRKQLASGASDQAVLDFMTQRYGDFVLYRPPVKTTTALLWAGPGVMLVGGLAALAFVLRRRSRLPDAAFDAEDDSALASDAGSASVAPGAPKVPVSVTFASPNASPKGQA
jgi:cytochrome c-type biogenesis protein CcmH